MSALMEASVMNPNMVVVFKLKATKSHYAFHNEGAPVANDDRSSRGCSRACGWHRSPQFGRASSEKGLNDERSVSHHEAICRSFRPLWGTLRLAYVVRLFFDRRERA
jgi:hypothetical protein